MVIEINNMPLPNWIRITSTPRGEVPLDIREEWVGVRMPASEAYSEDRAAGLVTGDRMPERMTYAVPVKAALACLIAEGRISAAKWWHDALPEGYILTGVLFFGVDEAELSESLELGVAIKIDPDKFYKLAPGFPW
jgi:hypothetical protein